MNWIKKLFGMCDRVDAANERLASAVEGLASDMEEVRARVRERFGLSSPDPVANLSESAPALPDSEPSGNGHSRRKRSSV